VTGRVREPLVASVKQGATQYVERTRHSRMTPLRVIGSVLLVLLVLSCVDVTYAWYAPIETSEGTADWYSEFGVREGACSAETTTRQGPDSRPPFTCPSCSLVPSELSLVQRAALSSSRIGSLLRLHAAFYCSCALDT
jgi:hypothetical protein